MLLRSVRWTKECRGELKWNQELILLEARTVFWKGFPIWQRSMLLHEPVCYQLITRQLKIILLWRRVCRSKVCQYWGLICLPQSFVASPLVYLVICVRNHRLLRYRSQISSISGPQWLGKQRTRPKRWWLIFHNPLSSNSWWIVGNLQVKLMNRLQYGGWL